LGIRSSEKIAAPPGSATTTNASSFRPQIVYNHNRFHLPGSKKMLNEIKIDLTMNYDLILLYFSRNWWRDYSIRISILEVHFSGFDWIRGDETR